MTTIVADRYLPATESKRNGVPDAPGDGTIQAMLHFDRDAVRPPHLVVLDGAGRENQPGRTRGLGPVLLVVAATIVAVVIDLVDTTPRWSPYAALVSLAVLAIHARLSRR